MEPTHTELLLSQAEAAFDRTFNPSLLDDVRTMHAVRACAAALIAIGLELQEINAKRPVIPIPVYDLRAPLPDCDDSLGED